MGLNSCFKFTLPIFFALSLWGAGPAEAVFQRAASALQSQDYRAAETGFRAVLELEPRNVGALGNLGVVYSRTRRYSEAIEVYRTALKLAPGDRDLLTNLGLAYVKLERHAPAAAIFERMAADPSNLQARELLATCQLSLRRYESALATLTALNAAEPENAGVLYMLGIAFTRLKRTEEARDAFTRMMTAVNPAQASFLMGQAAYETGDFERAAESFGRALAADPQFPGAHRELGKTLISLHRDEEAERELRRAGGDDPEALYFLGALLSRTHAAEATRLLGRAREMTPDFWGPLFYLGRIAIERGRARDAVPLLERAAALKPDESAIPFQLAKAFRLLGKQAESKAALARVKELKLQSLRDEADILNRR